MVGFFSYFVLLTVNVDRLKLHVYMDIESPPEGSRGSSGQLPVNQTFYLSAQIENHCCSTIKSESYILVTCDTNNFFTCDIY